MAMISVGEPRLELGDVADPAIRDVIAKGLQAFNEAHAGPLAARPLTVILRGENDNPVGGLWGRTYYGWLFVELLHLPSNLRGRGLGGVVIEAAEAEARARGCVGIWLDTFDFQAPAFYERLGFQRVGQIEDFPLGHARIFFSKML